MYLHSQKHLNSPPLSTVAAACFGCPTLLIHHFISALSFSQRRRRNLFASRASSLSYNHSSSFAFIIPINSRILTSHLPENSSIRSDILEPRRIAHRPSPIMDTEDEQVPYPPSVTNVQVDNAIRAIKEKKPVPEIDFSIHTMEDGTQVNTTERVCKGIQYTHSALPRRRETLLLL